MDAGSSTDAGEPNDSGLPSDAGVVPTDGGVNADAGTTSDAGQAQDAGLAGDAGASADAGDAGFPRDSGPSEDAGETPDGGAPTDAGSDGGSLDAGGWSDGGESDGGVLIDAGLPFDAGTTSDAGPPIDGGALQDAGLTPSDAGPTFDAGPPFDGGGPQDAGLAPSDAGPTFDGGVSFDAGAIFDAGLDAGAPADAGATTDAGSGTSDAGHCTWFQACVPTNPCDQGHWICPDGGAACLDEETTVGDGVPCGTNEVCLRGSCLECGSVCEVSSFSCAAGTVSCSGTPCVATGGNVPDLTSCGGPLICVEGTCQSCTENAQCVPSDTCHTGYLTCSPGSACNDTGQSGPDGVACGSGVCHGGSCATGPYTLTLTSGTLTAYVDQDLPGLVVLQLKDADGVALPDAIIQMTPPSGAVASPASAVTDANGEVSFQLRLNRLVGHTTFRATGPGNAQLALQTEASAPPEGTIFGEVNDSEVGGDDPPGPGTITRSEQIEALAIAADGTLYFTDAFDCRVESLSPAGEVSDVVGSAQSFCGYAGDNGPAVDARIHTPGGLALDDTGTVLFVSDGWNNVVRRVDLTTGIITTFAGGGSVLMAPWGDGSAATSAVLSSPGWLGWGPDGSGGHQLFIADEGHFGLRYVDSSGLIHTVPLPQSSGDCTQDSLAVVSCGQGCGMVWDAAGNAFISALICGTQAGATSSSDWTGGIVRMTPTGAVTYVGGRSGGSTGENVIASQTLFGDTPSLAIDPGGNLFLSLYNEYLVRRIDGQSGAVTTVAGTGTNGASGRYVPGTTALLWEPYAVAIGPDLNLYLADSGNAAVRTVWGVGNPASSAVTLTDATSYPLATAEVDAELPPFKAQLKAADGTPLSGFPVTWQTSTPGAGLRTTTTLTGTDGAASPNGRLARAPGLNMFQASVLSLGGQPVTGSPLQFTVSPVLPPSGTIYTLVNVDHARPPPSDLPGPGTLARPGVPGGVALASDGTVYESESCAIESLSPAGVLSVIAGTGIAGTNGCGFGGDGAQASVAELDPRALALDEGAGKLYVSDYTNNRVRVIDLTTGIISTVAGAGLACAAAMDCAANTAAPFCGSQGLCVTCLQTGDCGSNEYCSNGGCIDASTNAPVSGPGEGGAALSAVLSTPGPLALGNGGLFVADNLRNIVRFIDGNGNITTLPLPIANTVTGAGCVSENAAAVEGLDSLAWDSATSTLYVSASYVCDGACGSFGGVASIATGVPPTIHFIAGRNLGCGGVSGDPNNGNHGNEGIPAQSTYFGDAPGLAIDSSGTLYFAIDNERRIRRLAADGNIYTVAGVWGEPSFAGDYGPWTSALFEAPQVITFGPDGSLLMVDWFDSGTSLRFVQP